MARTCDLASLEPTPLKAYVLFWLSLVLGPSPDFPAALQAATRCVEVADRVGTISVRAMAIGILAWVYECHQQWEIARALRDQAIELSISDGNTYTHAVCLAMNAATAYELGELDRAQRESEEAAAMFQALDTNDWHAATVCYQGLVAVAGRQLHLGAAYYEQSLRIWLQSESASRWYRPLVGLADVAAAIEQYPAAARLLGAADAMLIVGGRDLTLADRPAYARAETRCREVLGTTEFEKHRLAGGRLTPDAWLAEAAAIVDAAQTRT
jgi:tetratricopeptide (TPR) repeat protein